MDYRIVYLLVIIILMACPVSSHGQQIRQQKTEDISVEVLTLDKAISLALKDNRQVKNAELAVGKAKDQLASTRTSRLPNFQFSMLGSQQLAKVDFTLARGILGDYANVGPIPNRDIKLSTPLRPTAILMGQISMPLSQQYCLGLNIKQARLSTDIAQEQVRSKQQSVVNNVKKTYYAILQTQSELDSLKQALKFYQELDRVTDDYVVQKVALKAEALDVKTRLAKAENEELTVNNRLITLKEQLNQLIGRDISTQFSISAVPELSFIETDLASARSLALENRPEIREAQLRIKQAELEKRAKKAEYIPDVSLSMNYLSLRNFDGFVPKNLAGVGILVNWEVFDWGRKKHQLAEKQKTIEQTNNSLREMENTIQIEVGEKFRELQQTRQALRVAQLQQETAQENMRVSINKYKAEVVLLSDVLQTQATMANANYKYQQALLAFWTAKAEYEKAIGADK